MVFLVEFAKSWRKKRTCFPVLVWMIFSLIVTQGTLVPLGCVVNQTGELRFDYKSSVVENGQFLFIFVKNLPTYVV